MLARKGVLGGLDCELCGGDAIRSRVDRFYHLVSNASPIMKEDDF